jgi:hypothetical protein
MPGRSAVRRPSLLLRKKLRSENPCWLLPAPSSRCQPPLAGRAAGVKFLLLHLPFDDTHHWALDLSSAIRSKCDEIRHYLWL